MSSFNATLISLSVAFLILVGYGFFLVFYHFRKESEKTIEWDRRLTEIGAVPKKEKEAALSLLKEQAASENYFQSKMPKVEGLQQWLHHAGLEISPTLFIGISGLIGLIVFFLFFLLWHINFLLSCLIGVSFSFILPWIVIAFLTSLRKKEFLEEFPVALDMIRRALRAGYSADRALEMVSEQEKGAIGKVFHTISEKMRLGEAPEAVLGDMANRIGVDEFRMLSIVIILQRETGGSLAEAIDNFAQIIRSRANLRKKVSALTAEVRVTAMILGSLPFLILGAVYFSNPHYLDPLFYTETGHKLLLIGGLMLLVGIGTITRMAYKNIY
jgi:tight adherence protein B